MNTDEPAPPVLAVNEPPPAELLDNPAAAKEWERLVPMLRRARQVTEADRAALIAVCVEWARYLDAQRKIRTLGLVVKAPSGYPMVNPYLSISSRALTTCTRLWAELGLTPSSRSRVKMDGPGPEGDAFSEFDEPLETTRH